MSIHQLLECFNVKKVRSICYNGRDQWRIQKFGIEGGKGREWGLGAAPLPKNCLKFYAKITHFSAKFSLVSRCMQSMGGRGP